MKTQKQLRAESMALVKQAMELLRQAAALDLQIILAKRG